MTGRDAVVASALQRAAEGDGSAVDDLVESAEEVSLTTALFHIAEALGQLGETARRGADALMTRSGLPAIVGARARYIGTGVLDAETLAVLRRELMTDDWTAVWAAAWLAGGIGSAAASLSSELDAVDVKSDGLIVTALQALIAVGSPLAVDAARRMLARPHGRTAAVDAIAALPPTDDLAREVAAICVDPSEPIPLRLSALEAVVRVGRATALNVVSAAARGTDRWVRIWATRHLGELGSVVRPVTREGDMRGWWQRCRHRNAVHREPATAVLPHLRDHLAADDVDVHRNAYAAAMSLGDEAAPLLAGIPVLEPDALTSPPPYDPAVASVELTSITPPIGVAVWQFLATLCATRPIVLHGTNTTDLTELRPTRTGTNPAGSGGDRPGVYATTDPFLAMYYAIVDRKKTVSWGTNSTDIETVPLDDRRYHLAVDYPALTQRPFRDGVVYVLPNDTFTFWEEWASPTAVRPLAAIPVTPDDFPLLGDVRGIDGSSTFRSVVPDEFRHVADVPATQSLAR